MLVQRITGTAVEYSTTKVTGQVRSGKGLLTGATMKFTILGLLDFGPRILR